MSGEVTGNGLSLSSAIPAAELLRQASLGFDRSAPQLLHKVLSILKTM
jgi:hypothetical protein